MDSPAGPGSAEPNLTVSESGVYLSWIEPVGEGGHALRLSRWENDRWGSPKTVTQSTGLFVNWADFPSVLARADGSLVSHWLQKSGPGTYAYDVYVSRSADRGTTWTPPVSPHRDGTLNEHGFVSLVDLGGDRFGAVWLDGRGFKHTVEKDLENEMRLMFSVYEGGAFQPEVALDTRVCDCCQTAAAATPEGVVVLYRDRGTDEVRDISLVSYSNGKWSEPATLHPDRWEIAACPVNGPSVVARGKNLAAAWFTFAEQKGRVQVAFSKDGGKTFGAPVRIDGGAPAGRVDIEWLSDESVLVVWLEQTGGNSAEIRARRVNADGSHEPHFVVAPATSGRPSGFPRIAHRAGEVFFAWTDATSSPSRVRTRVLEVTDRQVSSGRP